MPTLMSALSIHSVPAQAPPRPVVRGLASPRIRSFALAAVVAGLVPLASGCYAEVDGPPEYAEGYQPQNYDGYVVYYDDGGRPYYYVNGSVEAIDPQAFTPPPAAVSIPIALDDEIPAISARIGPATGLRFLVDTGADRSILFPSFASAHADALVDHGLGAEMEASFPFLSDFEGVGGEVSYRPIELGPLTVAPWTYEKWLFFLTQDASKFELDDYDGILGQDLLRYYDLYLDYPHSRILLVPNSRYTDRFGN